jgi:hypothetical protein
MAHPQDGFTARRNFDFTVHSSQGTISLFRFSFNNASALINKSRQN